ncbi:hypothetical protein O181_021566 [Austropuccinia psidii MF-1]|uniref:Uncharacterized protein n=1 Tax=Austropuccinia psidii MF-1 TaxID=1389203 RepID=A0A9Q3CFQ6_9BASI|nr:hypothetical protein [Austropuccinia psidii MF-1]
MVKKLKLCIRALAKFRIPLLLIHLPEPSKVKSSHYYKKLSTQACFFPFLCSQTITHPSTTRPPALASAMRKSPVPQPGPSPMPPSSILQPVARISNRSIVGRSPLPYPTAQVFQGRENWPFSVSL